MLEESKELEYIENRINKITDLLERSKKKYPTFTELFDCYNNEEFVTLNSIKNKLQAFDLIKNSVNVLFDDTSKEIMLESKNDDLEYVFILNSDTLGSRLYDEQYESMKKTLK